MIKQQAQPKLGRELTLLAAPMIVSNLAYVLIGVVDTLFLGRVSAAALGGVGLANSIFLTISLLFRGTINGISTFVSRAYGAQESREAGEHLLHFLGLALLLSPITFLLPTLFWGYFLLIKPSPDVVDQAMLYLQIRVYSFPATLIYTAVVGFLIGIGNSRLPALLSWTGVIINIIGNYLLIFGNLGFPALGVAGAAYATVIAIVMQMVFAVVIAFRIYHERYSLLAWSRPGWDKVKRMIKIGLPIGLSDSGEVGAFTTFLGLIARLGTAELAVSQIVNQISAVAFMPGFALSIAIGSLVGRFLGANQPEVAEQVGYKGVQLGAVFMGVLGLAFWVFPRQLTGLFTPDPLLMEVAVVPMRMMAFYQIFDAMNMGFRGALNGAGDTRFAMGLTLLGSWGVFVPAVYLLTFTLEFGLAGAWGGALIYILGIGIAFMVRYRGGRWKKIAI